MRMNGRRARPASVGEYRWSWTRLKGKKKSPPPRAMYSRNVRTLAPVNSRERKRPSGTIGRETRLSTATNAASEAIPSENAATTAGWRTPAADDSVKP